MRSAFLFASDGHCAPHSPRGRSGSFEIALLALGGCLALVDEICAGKVRNGYALVRPPGHHAESDIGRGYCLLNNIALSAMHAQRRHGLRRIAIFDFDVHHGNGTQKAFYSDDSVLFISVHQDRNFPHDSGLTEEVGQGRGEFFNINIPLPVGSGGGAYECARANTQKWLD